MTDVAQRSYLRDNLGPRVVESSYGKERSRNGPRRARDADDRSQRVRRQPNPRSPRSETSRPRRRSSASSGGSSAQRPSYALNMVKQPPSTIPLGAAVDPSVLVSLMPSADTGRIDPSRLLAVATLVADSQTGERIPLEAGILAGQKMFDSVQPFTDQQDARLAQSCVAGHVFGYVSFSGLVIRQSGIFRIRVTLIETSPITQGGSSVQVVDSEPIRVERRAIRPQGRPQPVVG